MGTRYKMQSVVPWDKTMRHDILGRYEDLPPAHVMSLDQSYFFIYHINYMRYNKIYIILDKLTLSKCNLFVWFQPSTTGGQCQIGYYCPEGSSAMILCTPGKYCQNVGLALPNNDCDPGYYCPNGSTSPKQVDCPVGHYCPTGSDLPEPCANGTYGPIIRLQVVSDCTSCDGGYYCNGTGLSAVTGQCDAGKFEFLLMPQLERS